MSSPGRVWSAARTVGPQRWFCPHGVSPNGHPGSVASAPSCCIPSTQSPRSLSTNLQPEDKARVPPSAEWHPPATFLAGSALLLRPGPSARGRGSVTDRGHLLGEQLPQMEQGWAPARLRRVLASLCPQSRDSWNVRPVVGVTHTCPWLSVSPRRWERCHHHVGDRPS